MSPQESRATIVLDLFEQYYHRVYCFSRRSLSADAAEDIAQEVFTRLLKLERLPQIQVNVSYLIKIADNLIKRRYNKNQRFNRFLESAEDLAPRTARRDPRSGSKLTREAPKPLASSRLSWVAAES